MEYFYFLLKVNRKSINVDTHRHDFALDVKLVSFLYYDHQLFVPIGLNLQIVKVFPRVARVLLEENEIGIRVSSF